MDWFKMAELTHALGTCYQNIGMLEIIGNEGNEKARETYVEYGNKMVDITRQIQELQEQGEGE